MAITIVNGPLQQSGLETLSFDQDAAQADTLLAAPGAGKAFRIYSFFLTLDAAGTVRFESGSTDLSGDLDVGGSAAIGFKDDAGIWETNANETFDIVSATGKASGWIKFKRIAKS